MELTWMALEHKEKANYRAKSVCFETCNLRIFINLGLFKQMVKYKIFRCLEVKFESYENHNRLLLFLTNFYCDYKNISLCVYISDGHGFLQQQHKDS